MSGVRYWQVFPPSGWFTFGTHVDQDVALEFWGAEFGDDGLPIWERPVGVVPQADETSDPDVTLMRRAAASERAAERHWPADMLMEAADTIECLRAALAASPADANTAEVEWAVQGRAFTNVVHSEAEARKWAARENGVVVHRIVGPWRHAATPPVAAIDLPGFEGTRSALDALTTRKAKTDD